MRSLKLVLAAATVGAWVAGSLPAPAAAQSPPSYQSSEPSKDEMMDHPPSEVTVTFDQPLDQSSWMNVLDECGNEIDAGPATVNLNEMTVEIGKTPSGMYEVVYKAVGLGTVTGSSTSTFEFMVHHGKPCGGKKKPRHHHPEKKKDDPHDHDDARSDEHTAHDDRSSDESDHSDHSGMSGMSGPGHSGHSTTSESGGGARHGAGHGKHGSGESPPDAGDDIPPSLAGGTAGAPVTADAEAVLIGLSLALAIGVLGGWLLRMSGNLTGTA